MFQSRLSIFDHTINMAKAKYNKGCHTVYDIKYHYVWVTKYRYSVLVGEVKHRARDLIRQCCIANDIKILDGTVGNDHVHLFVSSPTTISPARTMQLIKGTSSNKLQKEFLHLQKRYWGRHFWATGYFCATVGAVDDDIIANYIKVFTDCKMKCDT
jgi:putative transposase